MYAATSGPTNMLTSFPCIIRRRIWCKRGVLLQVDSFLIGSVVFVMLKMYLCRVQIGQLVVHYLVIYCNKYAVREPFGNP